MVKRWIQKTGMKKGAFRKQLEVPVGKTIGREKIQEIERKPIGGRVRTYGGHSIPVTQRLKRRAGLAKRLRDLRRRRK